MHVVLGWRALLPSTCHRCGPCLQGYHSRAGDHHPNRPHDRHLVGPVSDYAVCYGYTPHVRREMGYDAAAAPEPHVLAPQEDCTCGFFGLWRPDPRWGGYVRRYAVVGASFWAYVVALGKTCLHVQGFRCYRYRVLRLFPPQPAGGDDPAWQEATVFGVRFQQLVERLIGAGVPFEDADWREAGLPTGLFAAEEAAPFIEALVAGLPWREALTLWPT